MRASITPDVAMYRAILCCLVPMMLTLSGCEPSWRGQFPDGTKLYDRSEHRYFGKVIGFDPHHDFHNGTAPEAAVLIESSEDGQTPQWGSCATCAATFQIEAP